MEAQMILRPMSLEHEDSINSIATIVFFIKTVISLPERNKPALLAQICSSSLFKHEALEACGRSLKSSIEKYENLNENETPKEPASFKDELVLGALNLSNDQSIKNRVKRDDDDDDFELEATDLFKTRHLSNPIVRYFDGEFTVGKGKAAAGHRSFRNRLNNAVEDPNKNYLLSSEEFDDFLALLEETDDSVIDTRNGKLYLLYTTSEPVEIIIIEKLRSGKTSVRKTTGKVSVTLDPDNDYIINYIYDVFDVPRGEPDYLF